MKKLINIFISLLAFAILCVVTSCKDDEWDSHYDATSNRGSQESLLINSLDTIFNGRYSSMAQWFKDAEMADLMNSGLQFTILAVPNHTFDSIFAGSSYTASEKRNILMNAIFFKATVFQNDTGRLNLINERIKFVEGEEESNYLENYHGDKVILNPLYTNIAIYDAILHEVDKLFGLNEETVTYFSGLDSLYSRFASYFTWDTLYYADGTQQKLPSYKKITDPSDASKTIWITSLAPVRQLYFDSLIVNSKSNESVKIVAENLEFLMSKDVRAKITTLSGIWNSETNRALFAGFDSKGTFENELSTDSIIKFISKTETADSVKFLYYKSGKTTKEFAFLKSKISTVKLTGGNKIYFVDSLLINPKYFITSTDNSNIIDTVNCNVISKFAITEAMETLFKVEPYNEARLFSVAPDTYSNYASFFGGKLEKVDNTALVSSVSTSKVIPKDSVHYFQFRFPRQYFNTQKYKFTLIYAVKKSAPSFRLSLRSVNMNKDTTHIQYLYPLQMDGVTRLNNSIPVTITNADSIRRLASEISFATDYTGMLEKVTKDKSGTILKPISYNFYSVSFEPFQIYDYTEEVWLRFELGSVLVPMLNKTTTSGGKYVYINNFYFDKVEE